MDGGASTGWIMVCSVGLGERFMEGMVAVFFRGKSALSCVHADAIRR